MCMQIFARTISIPLLWQKPFAWNAPRVTLKRSNFNASIKAKIPFIDKPSYPFILPRKTIANVREMRLRVG